MGGLTIESQRTAREIAAFPEMEGETLRVGKRVKLPPCIAEPILAAFVAKEARPCPRVELRPDNWPAAELFTIITCEDTRALAPAWIDRNLSGLDEDAVARVVNRTVRTRLNERIVSLFRPPDASAEKEN